MVFPHCERSERPRGEIPLGGDFPPRERTEFTREANASLLPSFYVELCEQHSGPRCTLFMCERSTGGAQHRSSEREAGPPAQAPPGKSKIKKPSRSYRRWLYVSEARSALPKWRYLRGDLEGQFTKNFENIMTTLRGGFPIKVGAK